jgi:hypothetical protein
MKRAVLYIIFSFLLINFSNAQLIGSNPYMSLCNHDSSSVIGVYGGAYYGSTGIKTSFASNILRKGTFLTPDMKNANDLYSTNKLGGLFLYGAYYISGIKNKDTLPDLGYMVSVSDNQLFNAYFTDDVYNVGMFGNKMYEGTYAKISPLSYYYLRYQELQVGVYKKFHSDNDVFTMYGGIGLLKGQNFNYLNLTSGSIYTAPYGEYLELSAEGQFFYSDTAKFHMKDINGIGSSFHILIHYEELEKGYSIGISASDMGSIRWNDHTHIIYVDTLADFNGIPFEIEGSDTSATQFTVADTLQNLLESISSTGYRKISIPGSMHIWIKKYFLQKQLGIQLGIYDFLHSGTDIPYFYTNTSYMVTDGLETSLHLGYGGFTKFQAGITINYTWNDKIGIGIEFLNLPALVAPKYSNSLQGFLQLKYFLD